MQDTDLPDRQPVNPGGSQRGAGKKGHDRKSTAPSLGLFLADPDKISWVLNNFLTNAIRYAPPESTIVLSARQDGPLPIVYCYRSGTGYLRCLPAQNF